MPNSYKVATFLTDAEKQLISQELEAENRVKNEDSDNNSTLGFLKSAWVWYFCMVYFFIEMGEYAIGFWMPSIIQSSGMENLNYVGLLSAIPYLVACIVMIYVGRSADRKNERRWHLIIPMLVGMVGLMIAARFSNSIFISMIGLTLATSGVLTALPMFWTVPQALLGTAAAAGGLALINSIGNLAGFVSPYLIGWIKDMTNSTDAALYIIGACVLMAALLILRIDKSRFVFNK